MLAKFKSRTHQMYMVLVLLGLQAFAYANSTDNTFGDVADQFQQWAQGSYGRLVLMVALAMILGSFIFGGGAKLLWGGVGLALVVKYGAQILNTIAGVTAEVTNGAWKTPDSLGWDFIFEVVLGVAIIVLSVRLKKVKKEYNDYRVAHGDEPIKEKKK